MAAHLAWRRKEVAASEIALGQGASNIASLIPEPLDIGRALRIRRVGCRIMATWSDPAEFPQDVLSRASGKAGDEDPAITLADRQARIAVAMSWAAAHRDIAAPGTAECPDDVD